MAPCTDATPGGRSHSRCDAGRERAARSDVVWPAIEPFRTAEDAQKRLFKGPLDGDGRRSIYIEMTLMEPSRFLALFNQPIPKQTVGRRDVSNVPDQALALLNDPFVTRCRNIGANGLCRRSHIPGTTNSTNAGRLRLARSARRRRFEVASLAAD